MRRKIDKRIGNIALEANGLLEYFDDFHVVSESDEDVFFYEFTWVARGQQNGYGHLRSGSKPIARCFSRE